MKRKAAFLATTRSSCTPRDTACDPRQAVAAANKLINLGVVGVVGAYCSSATIPASEVLDEESIPMLTPASTNEKVTERGLPYMYRVCGRDDDQSKTALKFMMDQLHAKSVFIVDDKTTYSQGLADSVEKLSAANGIKVLAHDHINQGDKDFSAVLTKIKQDNPDVFYMSLQNSSAGALMLIQARRMGLKCVILAQDAVYHPQLIDIAKDAAEGAYLTFGYKDKSTDAYKKFMSVYAQYGAPGAYSEYAYDGAYALLQAIKKAGSTDPQKIKEQLTTIEFAGASKIIKFGPTGDSGSNYIIQTVKGGQFRQLLEPGHRRILLKPHFKGAPFGAPSFKIWGMQDGFFLPAVCQWNHTRRSLRTDCPGLHHGLRHHPTYQLRTW